MLRSMSLRAGESTTQCLNSFLVWRSSAWRRDLGKQGMPNATHVHAHEFTSRTQIHSTSELRARIAALLRVDAMNYTTPKEFFERNSHFFRAEPRKEWMPPSNNERLEDAISILNSHFTKITLKEWDEEHLKQVFDHMSDDLSAKWHQEEALQHGPQKSALGYIQYFLRWALSGGRPGPALTSTMAILGRDMCLQRIEDAEKLLHGMFTEIKDG